jgi:hypothetical protein
MQHHRYSANAGTDGIMQEPHHSHPRNRLSSGAQSDASAVVSSSRMGPFGLGPTSLAALGLQTHVAHEPLDPASRMAAPFSAQFSVDAGCAIRAERTANSVSRSTCQSRSSRNGVPAPSRLFATLSNQATHNFSGASKIRVSGQETRETGVTPRGTAPARGDQEV